MGTKQSEIRLGGSRRRVGQKGEANLLWYFYYFAALVVIFGTITYLGVNTFSVHSDTGKLSGAIVSEKFFQSIYQVDSLTGQYTELRSDIRVRLAELHPDDNTYAARVKIGNVSYYSDEAQFDILISGIGLRSDLHRSVHRVGNQTIDISVVVEK